MTETKKTGGEDLATYAAPRMPGRTDREIFVAVNGESLRIKRGATVQIPRRFLEVLEHAEAQTQAAYDYMTAAQKRSADASAAL